MIQDFRKGFKQDLTKNFQRLSNDFSKDLFISDIMKEGIMYACSMCIEFRKNAEFISQSTIDNLSGQVSDVLSEVFDEFNTDKAMSLKLAVENNMKHSNIETIVNSYYSSL